MNQTLFRRLSPLLPLLLLAGCAAPGSPTTAAAKKPGEGKGHWVTENAPTTGTMQPRRYWVSDEPGAAASTPFVNGDGIGRIGARDVSSGLGYGTGLSGGIGGGGGIGAVPGGR